jgi:hypothetical protein
MVQRLRLTQSDSVNLPADTAGCRQGGGGSLSKRRAVSHKHVRVHREGASFLLSPGTVEGVNRLADHDIYESAISEDLLPARTGQPTCNSASPQVDVPQGLLGHRPAVGDIGKLQPTAWPQHTEDLCEYGVLVGAEIDDPV